jgi:predicted lysophospholipase L1 biosynthesis ABC-type transport system permease subunit
VNAADQKSRRRESMIPDRGTIRREVSLSWRKIVEFAWRGIRVRLGRSLLVTSGIVLALAFLSYILFTEAIGRSVATNAPEPVLRQLMQEGVLMDLENAETRSQMWWMVGLALLVSFVGSLNAMLLSVTERFAEIGTMKCLGALDSLVLKLFLLESLFHGLLGTAAGLVIGMGLSLLEAWGSYGSLLGAYAPWGELMKLAGICLAAGVGLTVAGALYPAWQASRMQPVEAMRTEV